MGAYMVADNKLAELLEGKELEGKCLFRRIT